MFEKFFKETKKNANDRWQSKSWCKISFLISLFICNNINNYLVFFLSFTPSFPYFLFRDFRCFGETEALKWVGKKIAVQKNRGRENCWNRGWVRKEKYAGEKGRKRNKLLFFIPYPTVKVVIWTTIIIDVRWCLDCCITET